MSSPQPLSLAQLNAVQFLINNGQISKAYGWLAQAGYLYAGLAQGAR